MRNLKLMKAELIIGGKEITSIQNAIKNAGKDITSTIKVVAQVLAGIVGAVAGLVLLFMIVKNHPAQQAPVSRCVCRLPEPGTAVF